MSEPEQPISAPPVEQQEPAPGATRPPVPPPPGYPGYPPYGYFYPPPRRTNGLAIASLVVSIAAFPAACACYGVPGLLGAVGAVLGHVARRQIRDTGEEGDGLALAGVITGWIVTGLSILAIIGIAVAFWWIATHPPEPDPYYN